MLRCVGLLVGLVSGQDLDEASLLQTLRKHDPDHNHNDHHGNNYDNIICPFMKLLTRYNCIPDPKNFKVSDYKAALDNFGDDGGFFNATARIFGSPLAPLMTDITKWDGFPIEDSPVRSLGLADPVSQESKFEALVSDLKKETKQIGVREFAALLVKQSSDGLVNQSDIQANFPVAGPFAAPAMFHLFGTKTDKNTGEKTMSEKEFEGLFLRGEIPKPILDEYLSGKKGKKGKNPSGEGCPTFDSGFWPSGDIVGFTVTGSVPEELTVTAATGLAIWPLDPSVCHITTFPNFVCD